MQRTSYTVVNSQRYLKRQTRGVMENICPSSCKVRLWALKLAFTKDKALGSTQAVGPYNPDSPRYAGVYVTPLRQTPSHALFCTIAPETVRKQILNLRQGDSPGFGIEQSRFQWVAIAVA
ncbi:hypothetical protein TNCV_3342011 [Trichonephila clavipes]|nr:hypothetical protein TNCV_3342011 [Trichonephila clavipes]